MSENEFFHEIKRDGITSLHGIHAQGPKQNKALDREMNLIPLRMHNRTFVKTH